MTARSGTEKRRRTISVGVRFTPDEHARLAWMAAAMGVTVPELLRCPFGGSPEPLYDVLADEQPATVALLHEARIRRSS
jgi:hypothetical protein